MEKKIGGVTVLTDAAREVLVKELAKPVWNANTVFKTPQDNLEYKITDEVVDSENSKVTTTIAANNRTRKFTCSIYNQDSVINKNVRKMYEMS